LIWYPLDPQVDAALAFIEEALGPRWPGALKCRVVRVVVSLSAKMLPWRMRWAVR
jgi:hypothetical protein